MNRIFICTVGNSIAQGSAAPRLTAEQTANWDQPPAALAAALRDHLAKLDLSVAAVRIKSSAELNILTRLACDRDDEVVLLASDSGDGRAAGEALETAISSAFGCKAILHRIVGLQVRNAKLFREGGLNNLIGAIVSAHASARGREVILCPVGGFKSVIPFVTLGGMLLGLKSYYIFEGADALIELPPLPVTFDVALYQKLRPAFALLRAEGAVPEAQLWAAVRGLTPEELQLGAAFFERDGGYLTLSPLASVLAGIEETEACDVVLSAKAQQQLAAAGANHRPYLERYLWRIQSPLWRARHIGEFHGSDLIVWKIPWPNSNHRLAGFVRGTTVHVCLLYTDHDLYNEDLANYSLADFSNATFAAWTPTQKSESEAETSLACELDALRQQVAELRAASGKMQAETVPLAHHQQVRAELTRAKTDLKAAPAAASRPPHQSPAASAARALHSHPLVGQSFTARSEKRTNAGRLKFTLAWQGQSFHAYLPREQSTGRAVGEEVALQIVGYHPTDGFKAVLFSGTRRSDAESPLSAPGSAADSSTVPPPLVD